MPGTTQLRPAAPKAVYSAVQRQRGSPQKQRTSPSASKQAGFDLPPDFFVQLLQEGRNVVLLLDGLDEVATEGERAQVRQSVEDLVGGRPELRVVVTCRTAAYRSGRTALGADFKEVLVQALEYEPHIVPMVRHDSFRPRIDDFVSHARHRGSVIEERDGSYRFIHLAFQEFLAARHLRRPGNATSR